MKTARFLFTIIAFGSFTLGMSYAGEPSSQPSQPSAQQSGDNHAAGLRPADLPHGKHTAGKTESTDVKPSNPKEDTHAIAKKSQADPISAQTQSTSANKLPQPALKKATLAAKAGLTTGGLIMNKIGNQLPAKLPVGSGTTAPRPGAFRGRSDTPMAIGGSTASSAKNSAAALSGSSIKPKP